MLPLSSISSSSSLVQPKFKCHREIIHSKPPFPQQQKLLLPTKPHDDKKLQNNNSLDVKSIFKGAKNRFDLMLAIDCLQKLGVDYHFTEEIEAAIYSLYSDRSHVFVGDQEANNFAQVTLLFRLLRQARYPISSDVLGSKLLDERGEFKQSLTKNPTALMSLLEASYLNTGGEIILHKAKAFATQHLESSTAESNLAGFIRQTLDHPHHMTLPMYKARQFYLMNPPLPVHRSSFGFIREFARRDFIRIQSLHREELERVTRWWRNLGLAGELRFARDQPLKWYTWSAACLSNPRFSAHRVALTKAIAFIYLFDDIFDVQGSLDELRLLTEAIHEWDLSVIDSLPYYMRICYAALYRTTNEIAELALKEHGLDPIHSLKKSWIELCRAFMEEAEWFAKKQVPGVAEYMRTATVSCGVPLVLRHAFFLLGEGDADAYDEFMETDRRSLIAGPAKILRLWDDLGIARDEEQEGCNDGSILACMAKEKRLRSWRSGGAREEVMGMIGEAWEELNRESFDPSSAGSFSGEFVTACLNMARMVRVMYSYDEERGIPHLDDYLNWLFQNKFA